MRVDYQEAGVRFEHGTRCPKNILLAQLINWHIFSSAFGSKREFPSNHDYGLCGQRFPIVAWDGLKNGTR